MSWASSKIWQIIGFLTFFTLLSISMVKIEAFELFFEFTRSNESWDLDEYISVFLAALVTGVFWFAVDAHKKGDELKRINEKNLSTERRLSDARRVQALGTLAGGVAHSGNNLMQPILTLARISKGQLPDDHAVQGHLDRIITAAHNSSELFHSILRFSRKENLLAEDIDIAALIDENRGLLAAAIPETITLEIDKESAPIVVNFPSNNFLDIMLALLSNSVDSYDGAGGKIVVAVSKSDDWAHLEVRDQGCGIPKQDLERIFELFFTSKDLGEGTGLGLAIVKTLVEDAGGRIEVESSLGLATIFSITLPLKTV
jgi:signal transduction histidine kinase